jgi:hypothetical protein
MTPSSPAAARTLDVRLALAIAFLVVSSLMVLALLRLQPAGIDYLAIWAGGKAAAVDLTRLYDFRFVTELQGWPLGPTLLRPYAYPPTGLLISAPLAGLTPMIGYGLWIIPTGLLAAWAGRRFGAPLWFVLYPWFAFAAYCGQVTFFISALLLLGLTERERRPILAGVLLGVAAALKPQLLILLPIALLAERRWSTILATGASGLGVCGLTLAIWGVGPWLDWLDALPRFAALIAGHARMTANAVTPTAALRHLGLDERWALLLIPVAISMVWWAFRRPASPEDRLIALVGGGMLATPYAMNYELALLAPAVAIYLSRTQDRSWVGYLAAAAVSLVALHPALISLLAVISLPAIKGLARRAAL